MKGTNSHEEASIVPKKFKSCSLRDSTRDGSYIALAIQTTVCSTIKRVNNAPLPNIHSTFKYMYYYYFSLERDYCDVDYIDLIYLQSDS